MDRIIVRGGERLEGTIPIGGAKNSVLKLMAATTLAEGDYLFHNVPRISDVAWMAELLETMGMTVGWVGDHDLSIGHGPDLVPEAPYELVEKMRASIVVLGPLLARYGRATVAMPGGDDFGSRPIDMHLQSLEDLGAVIEAEHGNIVASTDGLRGAAILLEFPSVGATENALMAAVLAKGTTTIDNAAREPEIADLAALLNRMGGNIVGAGTSTITIEGADRLEAVEHTVVPDRIEAASYLAAVGVAGGEVILEGARHDHMAILCQKLGQMGMRISPDTNGIWAMCRKRLTSIDISTLPYPGLATDYLPLCVAMLAAADGVGIVTENLFAGRFKYVDELARMGADIRTESHHAVVRGVDRLSGAPVRCHDIRAGAALLVAGLGAEGETVLSDVHHIDRGYDDIVAKLSAVGASIVRRDD